MKTKRNFLYHYFSRSVQVNEDINRAKLYVSFFCKNEKKTMERWEGKKERDIFVWNLGVKRSDEGCTVSGP